MNTSAEYKVRNSMTWLSWSVNVFSNSVNTATTIATCINVQVHFWVGEGVSKKSSTLCMLVKMLKIMDDPLYIIPEIIPKENCTLLSNYNPGKYIVD